MREVKEFLEFLASLDVLTYGSESVLLSTGQELSASELAQKSKAELPLVKAILKVFTDLTSPKSPVMEAVAEEAGMDDFFVASLTSLGSGELTFTLYGTQGSVYSTSLPLGDLLLLAVG